MSLTWWSSPKSSKDNVPVLHKPRSLLLKLLDLSHLHARQVVPRRRLPRLHATLAHHQYPTTLRLVKQPHGLHTDRRHSSHREDPSLYITLLPTRSFPEIQVGMAGRTLKPVNLHHKASRICGRKAQLLAVHPIIQAITHQYNNSLHSRHKCLRLRPPIAIEQGYRPMAITAATTMATVGTITFLVSHSLRRHTIIPTAITTTFHKDVHLRCIPADSLLILAHLPTAAASHAAVTLLTPHPRDRHHLLIALVIAVSVEAKPAVTFASIPGKSPSVTLAVICAGKAMTTGEESRRSRRLEMPTRGRANPARSFWGRQSLLAGLLR
jgi:hypothetical protein